MGVYALINGSTAPKFDPDNKKYAERNYKDPLPEDATTQ